MSPTTRSTSAPTPQAKATASPQTLNAGPEASPEPGFFIDIGPEVEQIDATPQPHVAPEDEEDAED
jgi:hypothetical protein